MLRTRAPKLPRMPRCSRRTTHWAAIEIAAWLARALETTLRLAGTRAEPEAGRRDASRPLARASLLVQHVVGIATEPALVPAGAEGVLDASQDARILVVGLSERWRSEGLGNVRAALASRAAVPTLFVRRGVRPERGGAAPHADALHVDNRFRTDALKMQALRGGRAARRSFRRDSGPLAKREPALRWNPSNGSILRGSNRHWRRYADPLGPP